MFYWVSSRREWGYLPDAAKKRPHLMTAFPAPQPEVPRHVVCPRCEAPPPSSALIRGPRPWGRKNDGNSVSPVVVPANSPAEIQPRPTHADIADPPTPFVLRISAFYPIVPSVQLPPSFPPHPRSVDRRREWPNRICVNDLRQKCSILSLCKTDHGLWTEHCTLIEK